MNKITLAFSCLLVGNLFSANSELFISAQSKKNVLSKNEYKEQIGEKIKEMIDQCSSIVESMGDILPSTASKNVKGNEIFEELVDINAVSGEILKIVGNMQKNFSAKAKALIDNGLPFKKATKGNLQEINKITEDSVLTLKDQNRFLANLKLQIGKELKPSLYNRDDKKVAFIIKNVNSDLKSHLEELKKLQTKITACSCLK
ncbi:hypothetical protein KAW80_04660 [Candidatus Babeliales bacterium]|nr:hypothetical protein [Candidatus Babeliales bacterium]